MIRPAIPSSLGAREVMTADVLERSLADINMDDLLSALSGKTPGATDAFLKQAAKDREQVAALARDFLASDYYRPLVEWLYDITLRRPVSVIGLPEPLRYVDRRDGENAVIWQLLQAAAEGRSEQQQPREP